MRKLFIVALAVMLLVGCGSSRTNEYDKEGRLIKEYFYTDSGAYDGYGVYTYDEYGNEVKTLFYDTNGNGTIGYEFEYDSEGNRTKITYWLYDDNGKETGRHTVEDL